MAAASKKIFPGEEETQGIVIPFPTKQGEMPASPPKPEPMMGAGGLLYNAPGWKKKQ